MGISKPISALRDLKACQELAKKELGAEYVATIKPFVEIVQKTMERDSVDVFTALKSIKETSPFYHMKNAPYAFAAAVVEIVEETYFNTASK